MFQPASSLTFDHVTPALDAGLRAIAGGERIFDFSAVAAADSSAVAVVLAWQRAAKAQGSALSLQNLPDNLRSLMSLYDIDDLLGLASVRADLPHH